MNNKLTIPYILVGAGLLVCATLTASALPTLIDIVSELPRDVAITCGLLSTMVVIMFAMFLYGLNSRM